MSGGRKRSIPPRTRAHGRNNVDGSAGETPHRSGNVVGSFDREIVTAAAQAHEERPADRRSDVAFESRGRSNGIIATGDDERRNRDIPQPISKIHGATAIVPSDPMFVLRHERVIDDAFHCPRLWFARHRRALKTLDALAKPVRVERQCAVLRRRARRPRATRRHENQSLERGIALARDVLGEFSAHRVSNERQRCVDRGNRGAEIARVPVEIVTVFRTIGATASANIEKVHGVVAAVQSVRDVVPHPPRRDPSVNEQDLPWTVSATLVTEPYLAVAQKPLHEIVHRRSKLRRIVPRRLLLYVSLLYVVSAWALNAVLAKQAVLEIDPLAFTWMRFIVMTPLAFGLARIAGNRIHIERKDIPALLLCGACGYGIYQYCWIIGLKYTTPFASALLSAMSPIFTLAIVAVVGHERVRSGRWLGAVVALAGIAVFEGVFSGAARFRIGDLLTLGAALVFAGYNVLSARLLDRYTPLELLAITMAVGTLIIAPGGVPALLHTNLGAVGWDVWWRLIYATLFPVLLTYPVWSYGISQLGPGRTSIFGFLTPVVAGILSVPLLHASFASYELLGAAICLGGMLASNLVGHISLTAMWAQRTLPFER